MFGNIGSGSCYKIYPVLYGVVISIYCICTIIIEFACPWDSKVIRPNIFRICLPFSYRSGDRHTTYFNIQFGYFKILILISDIFNCCKADAGYHTVYLNRQFRHFNIINCYCGVFSVTAGFHIGTCHISIHGRRSNDTYGRECHFFYFIFQCNGSELFGKLRCFIADDVNVVISPCCPYRSGVYAIDIYGGVRNVVVYQFVLVIKHNCTYGFYDFIFVGGSIARPHFNTHRYLFSFVNTCACCFVLFCTRVSKQGKHCQKQDICRKFNVDSYIHP